MVTATPASYSSPAAATERGFADGAKRDEAKQQMLQLRKDRLLERAASPRANGALGEAARGTFFDIFKGPWQILRPQPRRRC
jgi:hypothetical protein